MWWLIGSVILGVMAMVGVWSMLRIGERPPKPKLRRVMKFWGGRDG